jgi:hypothetical protein
VRARLTVGELAHQQADKPYNTGAISTTNCVKDVFKVFVIIKRFLFQEKISVISVISV